MRANASLIGRRDSHRTKSSCPLGRDQALGVREEGRRRRTFSNRKGLKRSSKRHSGHRRLQQEATWPPCKSEVSQTAPVTATTTHLYPDSITQSSHRPMFSLRNPLTFAFEAHPEGTASSWRRTIMQRCCTMASRRVWWPSHPVTPPSRVFPHCPRGPRLMLRRSCSARTGTGPPLAWHNILGHPFLLRASGSIGSRSYHILDIDYQLSTSRLDSSVPTQVCKCVVRDCERTSASAPGNPEQVINEA